MKGGDKAVGEKNMENNNKVRKEKS